MIFLSSSPNCNAMLPDTIKNALSPGYCKNINVGEEFLPWYDFVSIPSTMETAHSLVSENCPEWTVITATHQSSGRGTHGRSWSSRTGKGLWLSVIMPPPGDAGNLSGVSILIAEVLVETLEKFSGRRFAIKHPNDVLVNNRKVAGILLESATNGGRVQSVILGMGVNFSQTEDDFKSDCLPDATSLLIETGGFPDRVTFMKSFLKLLRERYEV